MELHNEGTYKAEGNFKVGRLHVLEKKLHSRLLGCDLLARPHIESRIKTLKTHFQIVHEMLTGLNCSGFGWDPDRKTVTAEKPVWEAYLKELPKKFVRLYGKTLSSSVCLRPRCGSKWKIGLEKREDKVWLCQGWPEFAKLYALDFGHFLFFKYKGNSQFYVSICDISACEIHYPSIPANLNDPNVYVPKKEKTIGYDESLQMFDSSSSEEKYIPPSSPPQKRTRTNASGECQKEGTHHIRKVKTECTSDDDSGIHSWGAAEVTRSQHCQGKGVAKKGKYGKF